MHEGTTVTKMEPPERKSVAHGIQGEAPPTAEFAPGIELVAADGTGILVVLVVAVKDVGVLEAASPALLTVAVAVVAATTVIGTVFTISR